MRWRNYTDNFFPHLAGIPPLPLCFVKEKKIFFLRKWFYVKTSLNGKKKQLSKHNGIELSVGIWWVCESNTRPLTYTQAQQDFDLLCNTSTIICDIIRFTHMLDTILLPVNILFIWFIFFFFKVLKGRKEKFKVRGIVGLMKIFFILIDDFFLKFSF